jgi:hypothetical protein
LSCGRVFWFAIDRLAVAPAARRHLVDVFLDDRGGDLAGFLRDRDLASAFSAPWRSPAPVPLMRSFIAFATYSVRMPAWMMATKDCGESLMMRSLAYARPNSSFAVRVTCSNEARLAVPSTVSGRRVTWKPPLTLVAWFLSTRALNDTVGAVIGMFVIRPITDRLRARPRGSQARRRAAPGTRRRVAVGRPLVGALRRAQRHQPLVHLHAAAELHHGFQEVAVILEATLRIVLRRFGIRPFASSSGREPMECVSRALVWVECNRS